MTDSIKITSLNSIGANIAYTTLIPVVNMAGTPVTQKATAQLLGNLILNGAGGSYFPAAAQAILAQAVTNAAQPNITSVGTLSTLAVTGNINAGNIDGGNIIVANFYYGDGGFLTNVSSGYGNSNVANYLPTYAGNVGASNVNVTGTVYANGISSTGLASLTTLNVSTIANLGAVGNVRISGGSAGQVLTTNGNSGLSWTTVSGGSSTGNITFSGSNISTNVASADINVIGSASGNVALISNNHILMTVADTVDPHGGIEMVWSNSAAGVDRYAGISLNTAVGNLDLALGNVQITAFNSTEASDIANATWTFGTNGVLAWPGAGAKTLGNGPGGQFQLHSDANIVIGTDIGNSDRLFIFDQLGDMYMPGNVTMDGTNILAGPGANALNLANSTLVISSTSNAFIQAVINNVSDIGSADWVAQGHYGNDDGGWVDMGFTSASYSDPDYTMTGPGDGYIITQAYLPGQAPAIGNGSLIFATGENGAERDIIFGTGGFLTANIFGRISDANNLFELSRANAGIKFTDGSIQTTAYTGGANTGNVTFDDVTVQGVNGLNLSAGADFTANLAYLQVRAGDVASHIHLDTGNNSAYDLIVGDDQNYVQVSSTGNILLSSYDSNTAQYTWTLDYNGNLILAGGNSVIQSIANSSLDILNPNVSTMVLTPDSGYSSQALVLDPTTIGHIHLRSPGSIIDQPSANLFLGGEASSFEVGQFNGAVPNLFIHSNNNTWTFDIDGNLTLPQLTTISDESGIGTTLTVGVPPTVIVISGADFTAVNTTYTKTGATTPTWEPAGYNPATDPYIEFSGGEYGIFAPSFGQALYVNTGTLNKPLAQWNTNPPLGSVAPIAVYTYSASGPDWVFGADGNLTLPGNLVAVTASPAPSISGFNSISALSFAGNGGNITYQQKSTYWVDPARTDTYTAIGTPIQPFKTITAAISAAATAGYNDSNPAFIVLQSNITENVTLQPGIWLTSLGTGTHGSPVITGTVTVTSSTGSLSSNHYSVSNLRIVAPTDGHGILFTGSAPQRLYVRDMWIDANGTGDGIYMDNSGSGSTLHMDIAHLTHSGSGDIYCINVTAGNCYVTDIETSGATQVAAVQTGAVMTIDGSELDAVGDVVCETYGTGSLTITNSIITNTQANGNGIKINSAGSTVTLGNCLFSIPTGTGSVIWYNPAATLYGSTLAFAALTFVPSTNVTVDARLLPVPLAVAAGTIANPIFAGNITSTTTGTWNLTDNSSSSLSFDTTGKTGVLKLITTNAAEGVTMSGYANVTGNITGGNVTATGLNATGTITANGGAYGEVVITQFASVFGTGSGPNPRSIMQVRAADLTAGIGMQATSGGPGQLYANTSIIFTTGATLRDKDYPTGGTTRATLDSTGLSVTGIANISGDITGSNISTAGIVKSGVFTTSTIPAAATAGAGARAFVTDADSTTFKAAYVGGSGNAVPVFSDGSAWYVG